MTFLSFERRWACTIFVALYPPDAHPLFSDGMTEAHADRAVEEALTKWPLPGLLALRAAVWVLTFAPLFAVGRPRLLGGLAPEDRTRVLAKLYESPVFLVRNFVVLVKTLAGIHYMGRPEVRARVAPRGAPPPALLNELVRAKRAPSANADSAAEKPGPAATASTAEPAAEPATSASPDGVAEVSAP